MKSLNEYIIESKVDVVWNDIDKTPNKKTFGLMFTDGKQLSVGYFDGREFKPTQTIVGEDGAESEFSTHFRPTKWSKINIKLK